jgi:hypothetical protein
MRTVLLGSVTSLVIAAAACDDATLPGELAHARIMAVRLSPPQLAPGEQGMLEVLVTGADAVPRLVRADVVQVRLPEGAGDAAAVAAGLLVPAATHWQLTAPEAAVLAGLRDRLAIPEEQPLSFLLEVHVRIDERPFAATKLVGLGQHADNPRIDEVTVDGAPASATDELVFTTGGEPVLSAQASGSDRIDFAWFSSVGDLEHYFSPAATLVTKRPGTGHLAVVARDRRGGVDWRILRARVD